MDTPQASEAVADRSPLGRSDAAVLRSGPVEWAVQAVLALAAWAVLAVAFWLQPSGQGLGTHEQMGLQPCPFHQTSGLPCPSCGMTTAFALMAHGRVVAAVVAQPFGVVLFVLDVAAALLLTVSLVRGRSLLPRLYSLRIPWMISGLILLWLAGWGFKILYGAVTGGYGL